MPDLILHHFEMSPYSQKVRFVLGFKGLAWRSVIVPMIMPKPDVVALTGGYRRTPFLQIGADIYCDTALMCRVIDRLQPAPPLYPEVTSGIADIVAQWADSTMFWIAAPFTLQPAGVAHVMAGVAPDVAKSFGPDRAAMNPNLRRPTLADGGNALRIYLARLEHLLADGRPFLLGALPCIADFSVAHSIWFIHLAPPVAAMLEGFPKLERWYGHVKAFGSGTPTQMTSEQAIRIAATGSHAPVSFAAEAGLAEGDEVTVTPTDYAHDPVAGRLVGLGPQEVVIERIDERAGKVHVHFPRLAFQIKAKPST